MFEDPPLEMTILPDVSIKPHSWITERYTFPMPVDVEIFLVAFSAQNGSAVAAQFYDFRVGNG
jgi:hypothetical protein